MKSLFKKAVSLAVRVNWIWKLLNSTVFPFTSYAQAARKGQVRKSLDPAALRSVFADMTVMNGVFAGMKYPGIASVGSAIFPKLLGSYEKEIEPLLERICDTGYSEVVDIGCAEGYYAVGLAIRIKTAKVFAFDINTEAIQLCRAMAKLNNVSDRIITGAFCDEKTLLNLPLGARALIISDCEGFEKELFSTRTLPFLSRHDVLIEVHDFIDIEISSYLRNLFGPTHNIEAYSSIDDIKKAQKYTFKTLERFSLAQRKQIVGEERPGIMEWFFITPK